MSIRVETVKETGVALVTLDRPEKHNAIDLGMAGQLADVWRSSASTTPYGRWW